MCGVRRLWGSVSLLSIAAGLAAQEPSGDASRASRLESAGRLEEALVVYDSALEAAPADLQLLAGLERALDRLGRLPEIRPYLSRAVEAAPTNEGLRDMEFRTLASAFGRDSAAVSFRRWSHAFPGSATPYRQWALWLARNGDLPGARAVLADGQALLGATSLAQYQAEVLVAMGEWEGATQEWIAAVVVDPALATSAAAAISQAPARSRDPILGLLFREQAPAANWLAADLLTRWGRAVEGWTRLEVSLPPDSRQAALLVRRFGERARRSGGADGMRARGAALEWLADRAPVREGAALRMEAAQSYAAAGDLSAAQRLLERMDAMSPDRPEQTARSMVALIEVLADAGHLDEAEARFHEWRQRLAGDDVERLQEKLAWSRVVAGDFDRAAALVGADSSIGAFVVRGWIALYRGELQEAKAFFKEAGPFSGAPTDGTRRATMLVLLERIGVDRLPALGAGLFAAHLGDTLVALDSLESGARQLTPQTGRADVLALAGEMALTAGMYDRAESMLLQSLVADSSGPAAPVAEYRLAQANLAQGRARSAVDRLEHLILTFPESAMVPEGRRLLDRVRRRIPTP